MTGPFSLRAYAAGSRACTIGFAGTKGLDPSSGPECRFSYLVCALQVKWLVGVGLRLWELEATEFRA